MEIRENKLFIYYFFLVLTILTGCRDDFTYPTTSNGRMSFITSIDSDWTSVTSRSQNDYTGILDIEVLESSNYISKDPVYLHCIKSDYSKNLETIRPAITSRGTFIHRLEEYNNFGLFAISNDLDNPYYIYNDEVYKWDDGTYLCEKRYWPNENCKMSFYAYAPHSSSVETDINTEFPILGYSVPAEFDDQIDIIIASNENVPYNTSSEPTPVLLSFHHALTSVRFELNNDTGKQFEPGIIKSVSLKNIPSRGEYNFETGKWSVCGPQKSFTYNLPNPLDTKYDEDLNIVDESQTYFMIPQSFDDNSDAEVEVEFIDYLTNTTQKLTFSLAGQTWGEGERIVYRLSTDPNLIDQVFRIVLLPEGSVYEPSKRDIDGQKAFSNLLNCSYAGNSKQIRVESYAITYNANDNNRIKYTPFPVEFSVDQSWCKIIPDETVDGHNANFGFWGYRIDVCHLPPDEYGAQLNEHDMALKSKSTIQQIRGISTAFNLARPNKPTNRTIKVSSPYDTGYNTANCYVVNAPGKYCFPLVYGNAITRGQSYGPSFYIPSEYHKNKLELKTAVRFVSHNMSLIESPFIEDQWENQKPTITAEIVWMDQIGLINDVKAVKYSGGYFVEFDVPSNQICQGNAVVAVKANDNIVWSWHIWITDYELNADNDIEIQENLASYNFMPINLGWVYEPPLHYTGRTNKITINRNAPFPEFNDNGSCSEQFDLIQDGGNVETDGYNVVYQWGRPTPFPGGKWDILNEKEVDCIATGNIVLQSLPLFGITWLNGESCYNCISHSITHPNTWYMSSQYDCWMQSDNRNDDVISNLWSTLAQNGYGEGQEEKPDWQIKSIYDPCPVGYMVPQGYAMHIFDEKHMLKELEKNGLTYCTIDNYGAKTKTNLFFPFSGWRRGRDGKWKQGKNNIESIGQYWTALLHDSQAAYHLCIHSDGEIYSPHHKGSKLIDGMSIRPIRETNKLWPGM